MHSSISRIYVTGDQGSREKKKIFKNTHRNQNYIETRNNPILSFHNGLLISISLQNNIVSFGHFVSEENTFTIDPNYDIIRSQRVIFAMFLFCNRVLNIFFPSINFRTVLLKGRQFNRVFYTTREESSSAFAEEKKVQFL